MKFRSNIHSLALFLIPFAVIAQEKTNDEGFKTATVSDFLSSKYKWEEVKEEPATAVKRDNDTPFKPIDQKKSEREAAIEAHLRPTLPVDDPREEIPEDELGLDTVELREYQVSELYSPLMRMSEMKDLEKLDPKSGGAYLSEEYFSDFENRWLNRYHIPLIGKSQEQLAKERYQQEKYNKFLGEVSGTIEGLKNLNPDYAKQLGSELKETQFQYNSNNKTDDFRFNGPDAKF